MDEWFGSRHATRMGQEGGLLRGSALLLSLWCFSVPVFLPGVFRVRRFPGLKCVDREGGKTLFVAAHAVSAAGSFEYQRKTGSLGIVGLDQGVFLRFVLAACGIHRQCDFSLASRRDCLVIAGNLHTSAGGDLEDLQYGPAGVLDLEIVGDGVTLHSRLGDPEKWL